MKLQGMYQMPQTPSAINYDSPSAHLEPNPQGGLNVVSAPFQSTQEIPKLLLSQRLLATMMYREFLGDQLM